MALRNIVSEGDEILRKRSREVTEIDERICIILDDMLETMRAQEGIGIAAPQVGILKRMFIIEISDEVIEMINPEIIEQDGIQLEEEACLSVPGVIGTVKRPALVKMKGLNRKGHEIICEGTELKAIALCHEFDHLNGTLFIDKAIETREIENE